MQMTLADEAATIALGRDIAAILRPGDILALEGDLGAGKSVLARAIIRALAGNDSLTVPSPTYSLAQPYETTPPIWHFDLYRLGDESEIEELGFAEAAAEGVCLVEWPQKAQRPLARHADRTAILRIRHSDGDSRSVEIVPAATAKPRDLAGRIARSVEIGEFLRRNGLGDFHRTPFQADASARRYELISQGGEQLLLMDAPRMPDGPVIRDGKPYSQIAHLAEDVVPFIAIANVLRQRGFAAPAIMASEIDRGLLVCEHLGDNKIVDDSNTPIAERYVDSARLLGDLHRQDWPRQIRVTDSAAVSRLDTIADYDRGAMQIEASLLPDWYAPRQLGAPLSPVMRSRFEAIWDRLITLAQNGEQSLVLRDHHSPNIIWRGELPMPQRIGLIDFQDAMIGPSAYDLASLAQDARTDVSVELETACIDAYLRKRGQVFDAERFRETYAIMAALRNTKILGIFVRLDQRDGKPGYLRHLPRIEAYLARSLGHPSLADYAQWWLELKHACGATAPVT